MMRFNVTNDKGSFDYVTGSLGPTNRDERQRELAGACLKAGPGVYDASCGEEHHKLQVRPSGEVFDLGRQRVIPLATRAVAQ